VDLFAERRSIVQENGDIDEYFTLVLANPGPVPIPLEQIWFTVAVTDAHCDGIGFSDGYSGDSEWYGDEVADRFLMTFRLRGVIPANGTRLAGVHYLCRERCTVEEDRITYRDPYLPGDQGILKVSRLENAATVIFPADSRKRLIRAPDAVQVTSRTATWKFGPVVGRPQQLYACHEVTPSPPAACLVDDGIAALHQLIGRNACGEGVDTESALAPLRRAFLESALEEPSSVTALDTVQQLPPVERHERLHATLRDLIRPIYRQSLIQYGNTTAPAIPAVSDASVRCEHSDDYSFMLWGDEEFHFNKRQAAAVSRLHAAYLKNMPELHEHSIEDSAGWAPGPLGQNFKKHAAWGKLIIPGKGTGTYRLKC